MERRAQLKHRSMNCPKAHLSGNLHRVSIFADAHQVKAMDASFGFHDSMDFVLDTLAATSLSTALPHQSCRSNGTSKRPLWWKQMCRKWQCTLPSAEGSTMRCSAKSGGMSASRREALSSTSFTHRRR